MAAPTGVDTCVVGDVMLQCGVTLPDVELVVATHGSLNPAGDNAVVFPTRFGGTHLDNTYLIGEGMTLDPSRYFIVVPNLLGNGVSSSPSNSNGAFAAGRFPPTTIYDNVVLQRRVLAERYGVERVTAGGGVVDGGPAGLPLGRPVRRQRREAGRDLRECSHESPQLGLPRGHEVGADRGRRLVSGRVPVPADAWPASDRTGLGGMGSLPGLLSGRALPSARLSSRSRTTCSATGRSCSWPATRTTCCR